MPSVYVVHIIALYNFENLVVKIFSLVLKHCGFLTPLIKVSGLCDSVHTAAVNAKNKVTLPPPFIPFVSPPTSSPQAPCV